MLPNCLSPKKDRNSIFFLCFILTMFVCINKKLMDISKTEQELAKNRRIRLSSKPNYRNERANYYQRALEILTNFSGLENQRNLLEETLSTLDSDSLIKISDAKLTDHIPRELRRCYDNKTFPILITYPKGRLGNNMNGYATALALNLLYKTKVALHPQMKKSLEGFSNLTIKVAPFSVRGCVTLGQANDEDIYSYKNYHLAAGGLLGPKCFLLKGYPCEMELFAKYRNEIQQEFSFSESIQKRAQNFLLSVTSSSTNRAKHNKRNYTYVGIHVRRTDYADHIQNFGTALPSPEYILTAMEYYKRRYKDVVFIASSDDKEYLKLNFHDQSDFFISPGKTRLQDMANLAACNHSIMTLGSFGFWSSLLAGGQVVYPDIKATKKPYKFSSYFYEKANLSFFMPIKVV